ncbi:ECF transporter S component [Propionispora vibrioides]|uniref:Riboflavin transporter n=1 Tax=Propionispora vibrioides TaxID=112903 RepID=A0A1H8XYU9_9FIRM|nr:ECF transporter S component [Propionispora vibrioides]SEP45055.1 Riboflavin transporter FmnP [Propionispora vibrioides]
MYKTQYLAKIGLLAAVATLLMFFEVPVPMLPAFLKLDISELPAVIAVFSLGPVAGVLVDLIKNMLHIAGTQTAGIGELANFLVGVAFLVPAGLVYRRHSCYQGALLALTAGSVTMVAAASLLNYFVLIPLYQAVLHFPLEQVIAMGSAANPHIVDLKTFVTLAIAPFNAIKGLVIAVFTLLLYRKVLPLLHEG